jgi:hypothetical protein
MAKKRYCIEYREKTSERRQREVCVTKRSAALQQAKRIAKKHGWAGAYDSQDGSIIATCNPGHCVEWVNERPRPY